MLTLCAPCRRAEQGNSAKHFTDIVGRFIRGNRMVNVSSSFFFIEQRRFQQIGWHTVKLFSYNFYHFFGPIDWAALWRHRADLLGARV